MEINFSFFRRGSSVPIIRQTEVSECGLVCLQMIFEYHGLNKSTLELRELIPSSNFGTRLSTLISACRQLKFNTRAVAADASEVGLLRSPCILHWNDDHYVVLVKKQKRHFIIHDPTFGYRRVSAKELSMKYSGTALEIWPSQSFESKASASNQNINWWRIASSVPGFRSAIAHSLLLAILLEVFSLVQPIFTQIVIDGSVIEDDRMLMIALAAIFILMNITSAVFSGVRTWSINLVRTQLSNELSINIFRHLLLLPANYFEKRRLGDIVSRFNSINSIHQTFTSNLVESVIDGIMCFLTLGMMVFYIPSLSFIPIISVLIILSVKFFTYKGFSEASAKKIQLSAKQQNNLIESIKYSQSIRISNLQGVATERFASSTVEMSNSSLDLQKYQVISEFCSNVILGVERVLILTVGAFSTYNRTYSIGTLIAFIFYSSHFSSRCISLVNYLVEIRLLRLQGSRLSDIINFKTEEYLLSERVSGEVLPEVEVTNLSFRYSNNDPWVLKDIKFRVTKGRSAAVIGPSGHGKTTFLKALLGIVDPTTGSVQVGGVDLRHIGKMKYRDMIGVAFQDSEIFSGTIADNISSFDPSPSLVWMDELMDIVSLGNDIKSMPMGYNTRLGGIDSYLSAGQRQRIVIARALYKRPKIIIFDEATCHIDVPTEKMILERLLSLNVTLISVTHRTESCELFDSVFYIKDGFMMKIKDQSILNENENLKMKISGGVGG